MFSIINHGSYPDGFVNRSINIYPSVEDCKSALNVSDRNDIEIGKKFYISNIENYYTILPAMIKEVKK